MVRPEFKIVDVTKKNLDEHGLFCLKSKSKEEGYKNKIGWFKEQYEKGLRIKLLYVYEGEKRGFRSRGFIEYVPGECAWRGIDAVGWMVIHCLWVVGRNKGQGYGSRLIAACLREAEGMNGVAVVTSKKNWLPGEKIFLKNGFEKVDEIYSLELYVKRLKKDATLPRFNPLSRRGPGKYRKGLTIFNSHQCPYSDSAVETIKKMGGDAGIHVKVENILNNEEAQRKGIHPYGTFCVLLDGEVISYYPGNTGEVRRALMDLRRQKEGPSQMLGDI